MEERFIFPNLYSCELMRQSFSRTVVPEPPPAFPAEFSLTWAAGMPQAGPRDQNGGRSGKQLLTRTPGGVYPPPAENLGVPRDNVFVGGEFSALRWLPILAYFRLSILNAGSEVVAVQGKLSSGVV